jgi:hypothetical protein
MSLLKVVNIYYSNSVFRDVAESLECMFKKRNLTVNITHSIDKNDTNLWILFGVNELPPSTLLPQNYIVYQLEQISVEGNKWLTEKYVEIMKGAKQVWDYSLKNVNKLSLGGVKNVLLVPISYSDNLEVVDCTKIPDSEKDIDILFMGSISPRRKELLERLRSIEGARIMIADGGLWGEERLGLIKRSKIVINIHYYGANSLLEMARLSVLLANHSFIISETGGDATMDKRVDKGVVFGKYDELVTLCKKYLRNDMISKRTSISREGYRLFRDRAYQIPNKFYKLVNEFSNGSIGGNMGEVIAPVASGDKIQEIPLRMDSDGYHTVQVPELKEFPTVTIVTPTKNRKLFTAMMIHQVEKLDYPKDKLEWIIIDDSDILEDFEHIEESVESVLGRKLKVTCIHLEGKHTISDKRNMGAEKAIGDYICHLDDDDYYFHNSLKTKIAFLEHMEGKRCIGSTRLPVYNLVDETSIIYETNQLPEASMVYKKSFWEEKHFKEHLEGEGYPFTMGRREQCLDIPYLFSVVAVNHGKNVTSKTRLYTGDVNKLNNGNKKKLVESERETITDLFETMDDETQDILMGIKSYMKRPRLQMEETA